MKLFNAFLGTLLLSMTVSSVSLACDNSTVEAINSIGSALKSSQPSLVHQAVSGINSIGVGCPESAIKIHAVRTLGPMTAASPSASHAAIEAVLKIVQSSTEGRADVKTAAILSLSGCDYSSQPSLKVRCASIKAEIAALP